MSLVNLFMEFSKSLNKNYSVAYIFGNILKFAREGGARRRGGTRAVAQQKVFFTHFPTHKPTLFSR